MLCRQTLKHKTMIVTFLRDLFGGDREVPPDSSVAVERVKKDSKKSDKYGSDVESLKQRYRIKFETGVCIEIPLREILVICPRERKRVDAYTGLVSHLKSEYGVMLKYHLTKLNIKTMLIKRIETIMARGKTNTTIYVAGKVYDLATITANEIETDVQNRLDAHYGKDSIIFRINVWKKEKEVTINFFRNYDEEWYKGEDDKTIFCADADLLTGRRIDGFEVPDMWPMAPYGLPFSLRLDEFITSYKNSAKELGASRMKNIVITHGNDNLNVRLLY